MISQDAKRKENAAPSNAGELVGPYWLGRCLGRGGFGAVFEGTHQETGQRVAIKLLHGTKELEPEVQNRFVREIALLKKLDHENIVHVFDAGLNEDSIYCAMELVECGSLKEVLIVRGRLPWREAAEVTVQVSRALSHAHQRGCIHRDLKPANLYLSEDGFVKLGDLGLARDLNDSRLTTSGQTVGTWRYMPPEQITAQDDIDGRLDIYALGCIVFEMVAGHVPFDGANFAEIFDQHLESAPPRLDVIVPDCPSEFADLVDAMLEKKPENRPKNAQQVADTLEQLLSGTSNASRLYQLAQAKDDHAGEAETSSPNLTQRLQSGPIADARKPNTRVLIGIGIVFAILGAIVLALR
ncbi:serine/threonine protein kinase [Bythopirellula polymerisocia]|uniref:Serine/threonine-protein kinase PknH n=1 Tax=Bythopirellula polymerisocia TaxID=2528003 RepID=A0A5C6D460_9BACT|nr:serine/threonine-protein kinase [Bythopirellula polymerisocia]TWU29629.1 Serine/threonine-protein kinase PknH [Bythopirellula polymerisocia]